MGFDTSDLQKLAVDLGEASAKVTARAEMVVKKVALDIEATAKTIVPVDTGNLKNSIGSEVDGLSAEVSATTDYADYVEYGTSRMHAQPYMGPALDEHAPTFEKALGQIGEKIL